MTERIPGPDWSSHGGEDPRRVDALFAEADLLEGRGYSYDAEVVAHAAAILAERLGHPIDSTTPAAARVEPTQRARAAGRKLPSEDRRAESHLARLWVLAAYAKLDGRDEEEVGLMEDAHFLALELPSDAIRRAYIREEATLLEQQTRYSHLSAEAYKNSDYHEAEGYRALVDDLSDTLSARRYEVRNELE